MMPRCLLLTLAIPAFDGQVVEEQLETPGAFIA
jgi:hypothetical protein